MTRIAIVGGGIAGLATAYYLLEADPNLEVEIFEQEPETGGKLRTDHVDGFVIERGPDAFLASKPGAIGLSQRLELDDRAMSPIPEHRQSFVMRDGALLPLPQGLSGLIPGDLKPILRSPLLSARGKVRLALEAVTPAPKSRTEESIAGFMRRRYGRETWEQMIEPLLTGIYAGDGERLSIDATFPNLPAMEAAHGSLLRGAVATKKAAATQPSAPATPKGFVSYRDGMQTLVNATRGAVERQGGRVSVGTRVRSIGHNAATGTFQLEVSGTPSSVTVDGVVVATPAWAASSLLRDVAPTASSALAEIEHSSSGLVALGFPARQLNRPLKGYGYVVPRAEGRDVTAMTWVSSKWANRAPSGYVLVRVFLGRTGREDVLARDDADLVELAIAEMGEILGMVVSPSISRVHRWDRAMPQYVLGHRERVSRIEEGLESVPGLAMAGTMFRGVGIPDVISSAQAAARNLLASLDSEVPATHGG